MIIITLIAFLTITLILLLLVLGDALQELYTVDMKKYKRAGSTYHRLNFLLYVLLCGFLAYIAAPALHIAYLRCFIIFILFRVYYAPLYNLFTNRTVFQVGETALVDRIIQWMKTKWGIPTIIPALGGIIFFTLIILYLTFKP